MNDPRFPSALRVFDTRELVRGQERHFLDALQPLVNRQDVTLDLENIGRIDAAGLAALITLYCDACKAGHRFAVAKPSRHVREILALVGLDKLLVAQPAVGAGPVAIEFQQSAA